jgi:hypothetical protein
MARSRASNPHMWLLAGIVGVSVFILSRQGDAKSLNAGKVVLTFKTPVDPGMLRVFFSQVTPLDSTNTRFSVIVPEVGNYNLPGLLSVTPA